MTGVLVLYAHPRNDRSEINSRLAERAGRVAGVRVVDLYAEYPSFDIDVELEQQRLRDHEIIIFQHPVYWYSCPALLKEWLDLVLEHGFAYGSEGRELAGKTLLNAVTTGARRETYAADGANRHELRELFAPFEQTAALCRMRYLPPFVLHAAGHAVDEGRLDDHVEAYARLLAALVEGRLDTNGAEGGKTLSENLDEWITIKADVT